MTDRDVQTWTRAHDRFENVTHLVSATVPLVAPSLDDSESLACALRLDALGDRNSPYVTPSADTFRPRDDLLAQLAALGGKSVQYDHLYLILLRMGDGQFGREENCLVLLDGCRRETLKVKQRMFSPTGMGGRPTESMIYEVHPSVVRAITRAHDIEARVGNVEFSVPAQGKEILAAFGHQLFG